MICEARRRKLPCYLPSIKPLPRYEWARTGKVHVACLRERADEIKAYEARVETYRRARLALTLVVFGVVPICFGVGLVAFLRRRKRRREEVG